MRRPGYRLPRNWKLPPISTIDDALIVQDPMQCGPAVGARVVDWAVRRRPALKSVVAAQIAAAIPKLNLRHYTRPPQGSCGGVSGRFFTTPEALQDAMNHHLTPVSLAYKVCATPDKRDFVENALAPALHAGYPVPLLADGGRHWVLAFGLSGDDEVGFLVGMLNPGGAPSRGHVFDLHMLAREPDLLGQPICGGDVYPRCWVALVPDINLPEPAVAAQAGRHAERRTVQLEAIDTDLALHRLGQFDQQWSRTTISGAKTDIAFEGRADAYPKQGRLERVLVPFADQRRRVKSVLVFEHPSHQLVKATLLDKSLDVRLGNQAELSASQQTEQSPAAGAFTRLMLGALKYEPAQGSPGEADAPDPHISRSDMGG